MMYNTSEMATDQATFPGSEFGINGMVYRMYVKAWQSWPQSRGKFRG